MTDLPSYTIRPATPADLDRLLALHLALQDHLEGANRALWRMGAEGRTGLRSQLAARLAAPDSRMLVAVHEHDGAVGVISGRIAVNSRYVPPRTGTVDQAFVRADHRRRGVGARLVRELCRWFGEQGVEDLSLRYVAGNEEAAAFWAALGFAPRIVTVGAARADVEGRSEEMGEA